MLQRKVQWFPVLAIARILFFYKDIQAYKGKFLLTSSRLCFFTIFRVKRINLSTEMQHFASQGTEVLLFAWLLGVLPTVGLIMENNTGNSLKHCCWESSLELLLHGQQLLLCVVIF